MGLERGRSLQDLLATEIVPPGRVRPGPPGPQRVTPKVGGAHVLLRTGLRPLRARLCGVPSAGLDGERVGRRSVAWSVERVDHQAGGEFWVEVG